MELEEFQQEELHIEFDPQEHEITEELGSVESGEQQEEYQQIEFDPQEHGQASEQLELVEDGADGGPELRELPMVELVPAYSLSLKEIAEEDKLNARRELARNWYHYNKQGGTLTPLGRVSKRKPKKKRQPKAPYKGKTAEQIAAIRARSKEYNKRYKEQRLVEKIEAAKPPPEPIDRVRRRTEPINYKFLETKGLNPPRLPKKKPSKKHKPLLSPKTEPYDEFYPPEPEYYEAPQEVEEEEAPEPVIEAAAPKPRKKSKKAARQKPPPPPAEREPSPVASAATDFIIPVDITSILSKKSENTLLTSDVEDSNDAPPEDLLLGIGITDSDVELVDEAAASSASYAKKRKRELEIDFLKTRLKELEAEEEELETRSITPPSTNGTGTTPTTATAAPAAVVKTGKRGRPRKADK